MTLTDEQATQIKEQLFKQLENFPEDKRSQLKEYISAMNNEQLEEFLRQNQQAQQHEQDSGNSEEKQSINQNRENQCVYCLISQKQIESLIIYEDKDYLSVLEINPYSKGHTILIPKKHIKESKQLKSKAFTIANRIGRHIVKKLEAENFQITTSDDLKHAIINIIPRYKNQKPNLERKPAKKQELNELAMKIGKIEQKKKIQKIKTEQSETKITNNKENLQKSSKGIPQFSRRIP
jgi:histidine triad (HIT) family protein